MKHFTLTLSLLATTAVYGQESGYDAQQNVNALAGSSNVVRTYDTRYEGVKGSPFFTQSWSEGVLFYSDGKKSAALPLKHDVYKNQLVAKRPQGDSVLINTGNVSHFQLKDPAGKVYLFKKFPGLKTADAGLTSAFFQVLYEGKMALLIKHNKSLVKANYQGAYSADRPYDELVSQSEYYLKKADQTLIKIRMNKKAILDILQDKQSTVKEFVEKEKIDFKDEASVAKLLAYYDSL